MQDAITNIEKAAKSYGLNLTVVVNERFNKAFSDGYCFADGASKKRLYLNVCKI